MDEFLEGKLRQDIFIQEVRAIQDLAKKYGLEKAEERLYSIYSNRDALRENIRAYRFLITRGREI